MDRTVLALEMVRQQLLKSKADKHSLDGEAGELLDWIIGHISSLQAHTRSLSQGRLGVNISETGHSAGLLKTLQSNLNHVTWQTRQIAEGDLTQQIDFMAEFSESFNKMTDALRESRDQLQRLAEELRHEVHERTEAERKATLAKHKLQILSAVTRHDALNQLTAIMAYADLARSHIEDGAVLRYNQKIAESADRLLGILQFTKEYEMLGINQPELMQITPMIEALKGPLTITAEVKGLSILADPLLHKVFYNLYDNAVRHSEGTSIHVSCRPDGDDMVIIWQDDGVGVPQELKERIFEKGVGKNTGFGLFLTREILDITGASIFEDGSQGEGARFNIRVPPGCWTY